MAVVSFCNQKGGVGKTTLSVHIAESLASRGLSVCLYDVDPQGSITSLYARKSRRWLSDVRPRLEDNIQAELEAYDSAFDVVVVDTRPDMGIDTRVVINCSDLVITPVKPGGYDLESLGTFMQLLDELKTESNFRLRSVLNFNSRGRILSRRVIKTIRESGLNPYDTMMKNCEIFNQLPINGELVFDLQQSGMAKKITHLFTLLTDEIIEDLVELRNR